MENQILRDLILEEHSKAQCLKIVDWVANSSSRFEALLALFLTDPEPKIRQRAGWPLSNCAEAHAALIKKKHVGKLLELLETRGLHNAVKRNAVRIFQYISVPESYKGKLMDVCFKLVVAPEEKVAVKAFALTVLQQLAKTYPEILPELTLVIEEQLPHQSAAFKSRAKKILPLAKS